MRTLLALALVLVAPWSAMAADPILPLDRVEVGMVGEARTVVQGTRIETFTVTVVAVDHDRTPQMLGTLGPAILVEASGPLMERTGGIAAGMSGSPVYVTGPDGVARVIGAVSFGTGDERNLLGGVTPIEHMLDVAHETPRAEGVTARAVRAGRVVADRALARALERRNGATRAFYPLGGLAASGISARSIAPLQRALGPVAGGRLVPVGGGGLPDAPFAPGSTMSAQLLGGDVRLGAVGTTTYITADGGVLGFGHPFLGYGATKLILGGGYVQLTVPAPIANYSYKLAAPGVPRGTVIRDRTAAIFGRPGAVQAIPVVLRSHDRRSGRRSELNTLLVPDARFAPLFADLLQRESVFRVRDAAFSPGTAWITVIVESPALGRRVVYRNRYASVSDVALDSEAIAGRIVALLRRNELAELPISRLTIVQTIDARVRAARIVGARVRPARVRPGGRARLLVRIDPWRAPRRVVSVPIRIPPGLRPGRAVVRIAPKAPRGGFNRSLADVDFALGFALSTTTSAERASLRSFENLARTLPGSRSRRLRGVLLRSLPARHDAIVVSVAGRSARTAVVPWVVYGGRAAAPLQVVGRRR